jgi:hypothetical protein
MFGYPCRRRRAPPLIGTLPYLSSRIETARSACRRASAYLLLPDILRAIQTCADGRLVGVAVWFVLVLVEKTAMNLMRLLRAKGHRTMETARHAVPGQSPFNETRVPLSGGPSYREEYMHSRAQNIDEWLNEDEFEQPIKDPAHH